VVLVALMLLGLPFLFVQSASLSGSRAFAHSQAARIGRDAAENLGVATGITAVEKNLAASGTEAWTSLRKSNLEDATRTPPLMPTDTTVDLGNNRTGLDLKKLIPADFNQSIQNAALLGTVVEDEAGKVDPNFLSTAGWDALLKKVNIKDWDDNDTVNSKGNWVNGVWVPDRDADTYGELAKALAEVRLQLPGCRITKLEQLLQADTGHWRDATGTPGDGKLFGLRRPLTRAELDLLRPYLTLHNPGQGRDGLIDLGTIVKFDPQSALTTFDCAAVNLVHLIGFGTWLISDATIAKADGTLITNADGTPTHRQGLIDGYNANNPTKPSLFIKLPIGVTQLGNDGGAVAIQDPPVVNIFDLSDPARAVVNNVAAPPPNTVKTPTDLKSLNSTDTTAGPVPVTVPGFFLQDPLSTLFVVGNPILVERPPLAIASPGVVTVESAVTVNDPAGRQNAQESRRAVVQAVPQEHYLEHRWLTQGQMHGLIVQRHGSQIEAWPNPYRRVKDSTNPPTTARCWPDDPDLNDTSSGVTPAVSTGIKPATQPSLATGYANRANADPRQQVPSHLNPNNYRTGPNIDWRSPFGGAGPVDPAKLANEVIQDQAPVLPLDFTTIYNIDALWPDGLKVKSASPLAYPLIDDNPPLDPTPVDPFAAHGFFRRSTFTLYLTPAAPGGPLVQQKAFEMGGRQFSLWIKPENTDWKTGIYPIFETRMPAAPAAPNAVGQITKGATYGIGGNPDPAGGKNDLQNYFGLFYDATAKCLVLVFAPPTIEHTQNYGPNIPWDDPTTPDLDERCLGGGATALAPMPYPDCGADGVSAKLKGLTSLFRANRIVHVYKVPDDANGDSHFRQNRWYHLQVAMANDRPGGAAIILDGLVGHDVTRDPANTNCTLTQLGDHCTLPSLPLATAITDNLNLVTSGNDLQLATITVRGVAGLTAADLFPPQGMIKIDDEYFTYASVSGNTFNTCVRGHRQNTVSFNPAPDCWPVLQAHAVGAWVTPPGYRIEIDPTSNYQLYRGGSTTADELPNGDPDPKKLSPLPYTIWCGPRNQITGTDIIQDPNPLYPNHLLILSGTTTIPLDAALGVPTQFPQKGLIFIHDPTANVDRYLAYSGVSANALTGITALNVPGWTFPAGNPGSATVDAISYQWDQPLGIILISLRTDSISADPTEAGRYRLNGGLLQLVEPISGRIEWLGYKQIATSPDGDHYFVTSYFGPSFVTSWFIGLGTRGLERTDFVGRKASNHHTTLDAVKDTFPIGSAIIPVQNLSPASHCVATGDVITIMPKKPLSATVTAGAPAKPVQAVVRYASMDGYDLSGHSDDHANDTHNENFAFTDPLPDYYQNAGDYELVCWPGWSGNDLTSGSNAKLNSASLPRNYLPRLDALAEGYVLGGADPTDSKRANARVFIAGADADRGGNTGGVAAGVDATIDALVAGMLPASDASSLGAIFDLPGAPGWLDLSGTALAPGIDASLTPLQTGVMVQLNHSDFNTPMGLALIGGEVFAWKRCANPKSPGTPTAQLIGRGLLGSAACAHSGPEPYLILPIGPVCVLAGPNGSGGSLPNQDWFRLDDGRYGNTPDVIYGTPFDAPVACISSPDGQQLELTTFFGPRVTPQQGKPDLIDHLAAAWTRGLYNTPVQTWGMSGTLFPIVIGWWPRYASALPGSSSATWTALSADQQKAAFRSRTYAWAGFPLRYYDARFDPALFTPPDAIATVNVLDTTSTDLFQLEARALATGFDWTASSVATLATLGDNNLPGSGGKPFDHAQFANKKATNGAELRVNWRYVPNPSGNLADIAKAANCAPMLGPVRLRCLAPARILAVEDAR
jgi:hypothetical protein